MLLDAMLPPDLAARFPAEADDGLVRMVNEDCESPIEGVFAVAVAVKWLIASRGYVRIVHRRGPCSAFYLPDDEDCVRRVGLTIWPQAALDGARHDFMLTIEHVDPHARPPFGEPDSLLVIECDGHDYHERTKEQARRDRSRDRRLQAQGATLFRFTGSEIWADPGATAKEAIEQLDRLLVRNR